MNLNSPFYYPVTLHDNNNVVTLLAPTVETLPVTPDVPVVIMPQDLGNRVQGLYAYKGRCWFLVLPLHEVSRSIIRGDVLSIYANLTAPMPAPEGSFVWANGGLYPQPELAPGKVMYLVQTPPTSSGGGSVSSVNGQTGVVTINAANLPGLASVATTGNYSDLANTPVLAPVATTGDYNDLINKPAPFTLGAATATALGGVSVPLAGNLVVTPQGAISLSPSITNSINEKLGSAQSVGSGIGLVQSAVGGVLSLKSIEGAGGITITESGSGTITITGSGNSYVLPTATASILGGIKVGSGLAIDASGILSVTYSLPTASASMLGGVRVGSNLSIDPATGILSAALYSLPAATTTTLGGVSIGTGLTITPQGALSATPYTLPAATVGALGGIRVGSGLSIDGAGILSVTGGAYTLPTASATVLGGVKVGVNLSIDATGVLSAATYSLPAASSDVLGGVKVGAGLTAAADGTLSAIAQPLVPATTSALGGVVVGEGLNVASNGTISVAQVIATADTLGSIRIGTGLSVDPATGVVSASGTSGVATLNDLTGALAIVGGEGVNVAASGTNVTVSLDLTDELIVDALGYTPYDGATNPNGFRTTNQTITATGDVTGSGTTALPLTLAPSGVSAGTYQSVTVDAKGRVTAGTNPTTLAGFGITDALSTINGGSVAGNITFTNGAKITGLPTPTSNTDAATKQYVDGQIAAVAIGTSWRPNVSVATTGNIALTGLQTIDGLALTAGARVLVKDQTDATQNGVYVVAADAWARSIDTDTGAELLGMAVLVLNGDTRALSQWVNTNTGTITIGTTDVTYTRLNANGSTYTAGQGLDLVDGEFSISTTGVAAGTYQSVTVNTRGQVTAGAQLSVADVTTALGYTPYDSSNPDGYITSAGPTTLTGDVTGSGTGSIATTLAPSGVTAGIYKSVTVDAKGRVTAGSNPTTLAGYGITDALARSGGTMTGPIVFTSGTVTGLPTPSANSDAATKQYVDNATAAAAEGPWYTPVQAATTGNIALSSLQTIDGYAVQAGDRVLVKNQTTATQNGVYTVVAGAWTRTLDADTGAKLSGRAVTVLNGATLARTQWVNTNAGAITIGTTPVNYAQTKAIGDVYTAGAGLALAANEFSIAPSGATAGTYTKVTVNARGQVTVGAQLASADVTGALGYTPLNKAGDKLLGALNEAAVVSVAAASTVDLGATTSNNVLITGTTAITSFGNGNSGDRRRVIFNGALTLTYNAASLQLPGATNIVTAAGDVAEFLSLGASGWKCVGYTRADGTPIAGGGSSYTAGTGLTLTGNQFSIAPSGVTAGTFKSVTVDATGRVTAGTNPTTLAGFGITDAIARAGGTMTGAFNEAPVFSHATGSSTTIGGLAANTISMAGNSTITGFDAIASGAVRRVIFEGSPTLTHNATSLILPTAANIAVAPGDVAEFVSLGGGNWKCTAYMRANGQPLAAPVGGGVTSFNTRTGAVTLTSADVTTALTYTPLNKAGDTLTGALNEAPPVQVNAAATVDLNAVNSNNVVVAGSGTITSFGTGASGNLRRIVFSSIVTLSHSTSGLQLPGSTNIVTANGDTAEFLSLGASVWKCINYTKADGTALVGGASYTAGTGLTLTGNAFSITPSGVAAGTFKSVTVDATGRVTAGTNPTTLAGYGITDALSSTGATMTGVFNEAPITNVGSGNSTGLGTSTSNTVNVTGAGTIVGFTAAPSGSLRHVVFDGGATLTHNASSLILPGAANILTVAGDTAEFVSLGGGNWRCLSYNRASGQALVAASGSPFSTAQVFNGSPTESAMKVRNIVETIQISGGAPNGVRTFDANSGTVLFTTAAATGSWTLNLRHSSATPLNTALAVGEAITMTHMATQGATPFLIAGVQVDGVAQTIRWQGDVPTAGNANAIDTYTFTVIKTAASTYTVLGTMSKFA